MMRAKDQFVFIFHGLHTIIGLRDNSRGVYGYAVFLDNYKHHKNEGFPLVKCTQSIMCWHCWLWAYFNPLMTIVVI